MSQYERMPAEIAIHPDAVVDRTGHRQSYSARWTELARDRGLQVREVDVYRPDWHAQLAGVDGFMWRCGPSRYERQLAKRLIPAIEQGMGIPTFPSWRMLWHHEDKLAQYYLLVSAGIPMPQTTVLWDRASALAHCAHARYPFVLKLAYGYWSSNVKLVHTPKEATYWVDQLFGPGLISTGYGPASPARLLGRRVRVATRILAGETPNAPDHNADIEHGYLYAQEFLPGNTVDTKITIIGRRAFAFRRSSPVGDFRTTIDDLFDFDPAGIDPHDIRLSYQAARTLGMETAAADVMRDLDGQPVICEISSAYIACPIAACPGYWTLEGEPGAGRLRWHDEPMRAEDALFEDFANRLGARASSRELTSTSVS